MASFINKLSSNLTNTAGSIVGRENMTKFSNSINRTFKKSKYRDYMKAGNVVQLISKNSHMSLQICASRNDPNRLILLGNGQIGIEYLNAHFVIEADPRNSHLKFKNRTNYVAYDNDVPCILAEVVNPKNSKEAIRARNEFRLHEIIGSDEWFALESVYYPGRYLSILPDGSITTTRDKSEESAHFCLHVINVLQQNMRPNSGMFVYSPPVVSVSEAAPVNPPIQASSGGAAATAPVVAPGPSTYNGGGAAAAASAGAWSKEQEAAAYSNRSQQEQPSAPAQAPPAPVDTPPTYTNLFPQLPQ